MNPFPKILPVGMVIIIATWLLFSHNEPEPDNRLSAVEHSCLPTGRPLTKQALPNGSNTNYRGKSPFPVCPMKPSPTCTGTRFCRLGMCPPSSRNKPVQPILTAITNGGNSIAIKAGTTASTKAVRGSAPLAVIGAVRQNIYRARIIEKNWNLTISAPNTPNKGSQSGCSCENGYPIFLLQAACTRKFPL